MGEERKTYGTADHDAPVARSDFERAFEKRIPTPPGHVHEDDGESPRIDLVERLRKNDFAEMFARSALRLAYPDAEPNVGPPVEPRKRGRMR
jgi:hypothetical protein